jgi:hypothetical protein
MTASTPGSVTERYKVEQGASTSNKPPTRRRSPEYIDIGVSIAFQVQRSFKALPSDQRAPFVSGSCVLWILDSHAQLRYLVSNQQQPQRVTAKQREKPCVFPLSLSFRPPLYSCLCEWARMDSGDENRLSRSCLSQLASILVECRPKLTGVACGGDGGSMAVLPGTALIARDLTP